MGLSMRGSAAVIFLLVFLAATSLIAAKPAFSSGDTAEDTWAAKASMNQARAGSGVAVVNGKIYAIGGTTATGQYPPDGYRGGFVGTNEEYDPATNKWTTKASMPTPRDKFAIVAFQAKIYCIGGAVDFTVDELSGFYSIVASGVNEVYDPATDTWARLAPMPTEGVGFQAHVVNGKIYVIDGTYPYVYDPKNNSWTLKTRMPWPYPKPHLVSAVVGDKIIVSGEFSTGLGSSLEEMLSDEFSSSEQRIKIYDTVNDSWSEGASDPTVVIRGVAGATVGVNALQRVYVLGLERGLPPPSVNQVYDPRADAWATATAMPTGRIDFGVAVVDDVLYAIGGYIFTDSMHGMVRPVAVNEQYLPLGYGAPDPIYVLEHTAPEISFLSPLNQTYFNSSVPLIFTVDKPVNWTSYSLDDALNVTLVGNTTFNELSLGAHSVTVYAKDTFGIVGASETVLFYVAEPFPVAPVAAAFAVTIALVVASLSIYFKKRRHFTDASV
jgi:N-acetylneuraminic acid mutarotase